MLESCYRTPTRGRFTGSRSPSRRVDDIETPSAPPLPRRARFKRGGQVVQSDDVISQARHAEPSYPCRQDDLNEWRVGLNAPHPRPVSDPQPCARARSRCPIGCPKRGGRAARSLRSRATRLRPNLTPCSDARYPRARPPGTRAYTLPMSKSLLLDAPPGDSAGDCRHESNRRSRVVRTQPDGPCEKLDRGTRDPLRKDSRMEAAIAHGFHAPPVYLLIIMGWWRRTRT